MRHEQLTQARTQVAALQEQHRAIGQHLLDAHKPGEVDEEAVAILDGYHVGAREVAGGGQGEPGETTLQAALRLLKLAHARGAFNHAPTGQTFRVALIDSADAIPHWVDADEFKGGTPVQIQGIGLALPAAELVITDPPEVHAACVTDARRLAGARASPSHCRVAATAHGPPVAPSPRPAAVTESPP